MSHAPFARLVNYFPDSCNLVSAGIGFIILTCDQLGDTITVSQINKAAANDRILPAREKRRTLGKRQQLIEVFIIK